MVLHKSIQFWSANLRRNMAHTTKFTQLYKLCSNKHVQMGGGIKSIIGILCDSVVWKHVKWY